MSDFKIYTDGVIFFRHHWYKIYILSEVIKWVN